MKKWFSKITPCVIAAVLSIFAIAWGYFDMENSGGWSFIAVIVFIPILVAVIVVDVIVKLIFKRKPYHIWGIEMVAVAIIYFIQFRHYYL